MRARIPSLLFATLALIFFTYLASADTPHKSYPFPLTELERVIWSWFIDVDLQVSRIPSAAGEVLLRASNEEENWQVRLRPRSPLATEIFALCVLNGQPDGTRVEELWAYLAEYTRNDLSRGEEVFYEAPPAVLSRRESTVCIDAKLKSNQIHFTGFLIDPRGLILSTAHDLEEVREITVTFQNGRKFKAVLVRTDPHRDLALIGIGARVNPTISLSRGPSILAEGMRLYSMGCSNNCRVTINSAVIYGPPRLMNDMPLWQVTMKTVPGSSGGPVFDGKGNLVAVVKGRYRGTDSVGFLIPLATVREFLTKR